MKYLAAALTLAFVLTSAPAFSQQAPNWTNDAGISNMTDVYTGNQRPGATSAFFNGQIWVAYTSNNCSSGCLIKIAASATPYTPAQQGALSFSTPAYVNVANIGNVTSYYTPSLTVQGGYLYLSYTDTNNNNWLTRSLNGTSWDAPYQLDPQGIDTWGTAIASDGTNFWAGFADANTFVPRICSVSINNPLTNSTQSCGTFSNLSQMNFNPALLVNTTLSGRGVIMAYEWRGDQHCLSGYVLDPTNGGYSYDWMPSGNCNDQTSVTPSFAFYNNQVFLAFGGNNSNRQLNVRYGAYGQGQLSTPYKQTLPQGMNGPANILTFSPTYGNPELVCFYAWNGQIRYLFGSY